MSKISPEGGAAGNTTVHFKGFASGLNFATLDQEVEAAVRALEKYDIIVWDGDLHADCSFTEVLTKDALKDKKLIAYRKKGDIPSFHESWKGTSLDIEVREAPDDLAWDELGTFALCRTGATDVVTIGGGKTVLEECRANPHVTFYVVGVSRVRPDGTYEGSSLLGEPLPNVVDITPAEEEDMPGRTTSGMPPGRMHSDEEF
jgi:hypothetical protein